MLFLQFKSNLILTKLSTLHSTHPAYLMFLNFATVFAHTFLHDPVVTWYCVYWDK